MSVIWASCGIAAWDRCLEAVSHRGPRQVLTAEERPADGGIEVAFDGRIDNRRELAARLRAPVTADDRNLFALAWREWGEQALTHVNGPFAAVVHDPRRRRLIGLRDRFGMRPLYVCRTNAGLAFASEIKQFIAGGVVAPRVHEEALLDYLVDGLTDHRPETLFESVWRVPAASVVEIDVNAAAGAKPASRRWYELPSPGSLDLGEAEAVERFRALLAGTVLDQWSAARDGALCLSGGIDSASIAGLLAAGGFRGIGGFKASFADDRYDDWPLFDSVVTLTGARSHVITCTLPEALAALEPLVWHLDEPFSRASLGAQWWLMEHAARHGVRATLDGQGADEQLGGYTSMIETHRAYETNGDGHDSAAASRRAPAHPGADSGYRWLAPSLRAAAMTRTNGHATAPRPLGVLCRERMHAGDLPMMMRDNDRIGAAHGIDTHVPFLDHRVVELTIGIGDRHKYVGGASKYLLRRAMRDVLPEPVLAHRGKGSYSTLEEEWIRAAGDTIPRLASQKAREWSGVFDAAEIDAIGSRLANADKASVLLLWRVIAFAAWAERFGVAT